MDGRSDSASLEKTDEEIAMRPRTLVDGNEIGSLRLTSLEHQTSG
jgi:hypothetical protein